KLFFFINLLKSPLPAGFSFWFEKLMVLTIQDSKAKCWSEILKAFGITASDTIASSVVLKMRG
ncbi:hypothetical protein SMU77_05840, partial [Streptococcus mutans NV1996]